MNSKFILNTIPSPVKELFSQFYSKLITRDDFTHSRTESTFNNKTKKFEFTFTGFSELYMINSDLLNLTKKCYNTLLWSKYGIISTHIRRPEDIETKLGNIKTKLGDQWKKIKDSGIWKDLKNLTGYQIKLLIMAMAIVIIVTVILLDIF